MNRFAALIDGLLFTPSRNGKLRLMAEYFSTAPDPERGWALAALTGELSFAEAKPNQVRALAMARVDPDLFAWSLDFRRRPCRDGVADLAGFRAERGRGGPKPHGNRRYASRRRPSRGRRVSRRLAG